MEKRERKIGKWTVEVHKMEGLYPYVRLEDFMKVCKELEEENKKLRHKNELQLKALIKLCLKHHYDSIIIEGEEVIDMSNYKVVEKKKPQEEKLF